MNKIIEKLSWIPYNFLMRRANKKNPIVLNFESLGINEKFIFYLEKRDLGLSAQFRAFGFREPINYRYHYNFIEEDDVVLDIGANLGMFTLLSKKAKKIICVEPLKESISILKKNIEKNGLKNKCKIINAVVGKEEGILLVEINNSLNLSKIVKKEGKRTRKVRSYPLSKFDKKYQPNVLRMDVEGYEYDILMNNIPKNVNKISVEFHTWLIEKEKVVELIKYLDKEGFKIKYLIESVPLRMYPFFKILKKTNNLNKVIYVKKNLRPTKALKEIFGGRRKLKYLFLERK